MVSGGVTMLSAEGVGQLQEGIGLVLSRWTALQMAVENEWGGRDSRQQSQQLAADIFSWLTQSKEPLYIDDLEEMLDEFMLSINTQIEDGSIEEVAEKLMVMHEDCLDGNYKSIDSLKETIPPRGAVPPIRQGTKGKWRTTLLHRVQWVVSDDDDDSDDDQSLDNDDLTEMAVDGPELQLNSNCTDVMFDDQRPNEAAQVEDGWTVVASRRNGGRRN